MMANPAHESVGPKHVIQTSCGGCGLGCIGTLLVCVVASAFGWTIFPVNTAFLGGAAALVLAFLTAIVAAIVGRRLPWNVYVIETVAVAVLVVAFFLWDSPREVFRMVLGSPIPRSVKILRTNHDHHPVDPAAYIHFRASPEDMSDLIARNELVRDEGLPDLRLAPDWFKGGRFKLRSRQHFRKTVNRSDHPMHISYTIDIWVSDSMDEAIGCFLDF